MNNDDDPLGNSMGIPPIPPRDFSSAISEIVKDAYDDNAVDDFTKARANIIQLLDNGMGAVEVISQIANSSQDVKAFDALSKLMNSVVAANESLLNLQEKIRKIQNADAAVTPEVTNQTINNNLFVGSTAELQKAIESIRMK